jgi:hypothetical protein
MSDTVPDSGLQPRPSAADLVLRNARIFTGDPAQAHASSLAASNGLIFAVGLAAIHGYHVAFWSGPDWSRRRLWMFRSWSTPARRTSPRSPGPTERGEARVPDVQPETPPRSDAWRSDTAQ